MSVDSQQVQEVVLQGIGVSPGLAIGPAFMWTTADEAIDTTSIMADGVTPELKRLEEAIVATRQQLSEIQQRLAREIDAGNAGVFDAHLMFLDDRHLVESAITHIRDDLMNAKQAMHLAGQRYMQMLNSVEDDYLRERVIDVRDVVRRIQNNLSGSSPVSANEITEKSLIVASELAPSDTAGMTRDKVSAFATDHGSPTSHTAVMARALEIPAVVGLHDVSSRVRSDDVLLIDGTRGIVVINPSEERLADHRRSAEEQAHIRSELSALKDLPTETTDGHSITLAANIDNHDEVDAVLAYGANGVGLYRSEYLFITSHDGIPSEESQFESYSYVAERLAPSPVIIRTVDLGGDKFASHIDLPKEMNPFLGLRAIRFSLAAPEIFETQVRAILRASRGGNVKILYPMITNESEVLRANEIVERMMAQLRNEGLPFDEEIEIGAMIETPSAAMTADVIAPHVDFFSVGTNDLIQYTLAVDRGNDLVADLYEPTHPAIIRLLKSTFDAAHRNDIWVGVCGEMAGDPFMAPLLVGLGVNELSVSPSVAPLIKDIIRNISLDEATRLSEEALRSRSAAEILDLCRELTARVAPELIELLG